LVPVLSIFLFLRFQNTAQRLPGAAQAALDRAGGQAGGLGHLLVAELLAVVEIQQQLLLRLQLAHSLPKRLPPGLLLVVLIRRRARVGGLLPALGHGLLSAHTGAFENIQTGVVGDAEQPGGYPIAAEGIERPEGTQHAFLGCILRLLRVLEHMQTVSVHHRGIGPAAALKGLGTGLALGAHRHTSFPVVFSHYTMNPSPAQAQHVTIAGLRRECYNSMVL